MYDYILIFICISLDNEKYMNTKGTQLTHWGLDKIMHISETFLNKQNIYNFTSILVVSPMSHS